jgi:N-formylglutamate amidohydrolase
VLEDRLVDQLIWRAVATGATAIVAHSPRAEIDLNRDEREIDPAMVIPSPSIHSSLLSMRLRNGLGLIPSRIAGSGSIWRHRTSQDEVQRRINHIYRPYHAALAKALEKARAIFGIAILLDCHSMPPRGKNEAGLVFGDLHGTSIAPEFMNAALVAARAAGFNAACNTPYAGGYITSRHGRPSTGFHALQLEISRDLYLDTELYSPGTGFNKITCLIASITSALTDQALNFGQAIAAE